ncbi:hypothetical protein IY145_01280 [Methylosinus sp. H3A]|uniref:hypothetical protein n=1 Tax=Methylosinus sp. H3A TaxID=2785786 RepID=UPI0018C2B4D5|nr:hypothetical protein [Methylosinus sp. H3A]MBG0808050.1 hypothetical protein [Methylosinus sp. H3A]
MRGDRAHVIAIVATRDGTLPLLFVDGPDGGVVMQEQVALVRHIAGQGYSPSQQLKLTESIGRFYDWLLIAERGIPANPDAVPAALRRFLIARYQGTIQPDGSDPTGLFWRPVKAQTVDMDRRHLNKLPEATRRRCRHIPTGERRLDTLVQVEAGDGSQTVEGVVVDGERNDTGAVYFDDFFTVFTTIDDSRGELIRCNGANCHVEIL